MEGIIRFVEGLNPNIEKKLRTAGIKLNPVVFISKNIRFSLIFSAVISIISTLIVVDGIANRGWNSSAYAFIPVIFLLFFFIFINVLFSSPNFMIKRRRIELESDLLYSSRFFLLKLESGSPLLNALVDVSNLHTNSSKFFKEIVADIYLGTPIEEAIDIAKNYSPSKAFSKILDEIRTSLRTGADIERSLKATLDEMTKSHVIMIKEYGKKLSPLSMFYMIIGTIVPSLGSAMIVVGLGFVNLNITFTVFLFLLFVLGVVQIFFIMFFKALKPPVMN